MHIRARAMSDLYILSSDQYVRINDHMIRFLRWIHDTSVCVLHTYVHIRTRIASVSENSDSPSVSDRE